jgi:hypothetical protein
MVLVWCKYGARQRDAQKQDNLIRGEGAREEPRGKAGGK